MIINPEHNIKLLLIFAVCFETAVTHLPQCTACSQISFCIVISANIYKAKNTVWLSNETHMSFMLFHIIASDQNNTKHHCELQKTEILLVAYSQLWSKHLLVSPSHACNIWNTAQNLWLYKYRPSVKELKQEFHLSKIIEISSWFASNVATPHQNTMSFAKKKQQDSQAREDSKAAAC